MPIDANDLTLFAQLIDAGSFTKAADKIGLPKSTLSRRVASLEASLGERLITRNTRQIVITAFGEQILKSSRCILEELDAVSGLIQDRQATPSGLLRVSLPVDFDEMDLAALIEKYSVKLPNVRLELDISSRRVDLVEERFDLAIRVSMKRPEEATLLSRKISDIKCCLYASPAYLTRYGVPVTPDDLNAHIGLGLGQDARNVQKWLLKNTHGESWEGIPTGPLIVNSPFLLRDMALRGLGITGLSEHKAKSYLDNGRLVRVLPEWWLPTASVWCVLPTRRLLPARIAEFIEMLRDSLSG